MKNKYLLMSIPLILSAWNCFAQESEWEPQKNITGYISLEGDNFFNLKNYARDYGVSISEAGFLASYRPMEKLTFKSVFVYRPNYSIDQMVNEINAEYKIFDFLNLKAGRFLTPVSPMNTYYYAPVNNSATLPMVITSHEFFPLNVDAISLNGKYGETLKIDYEVIGGGFRNSLWLNNGALGLFGTESTYFRKLNGDTMNIDDSSLNTTLQTAFGGHLGVAFRDYITLGFGTFQTSEAMNVAGTTIKAKKRIYGANLKIKYSTLRLIAEYWQFKPVGVGDGLAPVGGTTPPAGGTLELGVAKTAFAELSNTFGKIIPYVRYEIYMPMETNMGTSPGAGPVQSEDLYRYTMGVNIKPGFETSIKLEYLYYQQGSNNLSGIVGTLTFSF